MIKDLNADVGEGFPTETLLLPLVSSANIACGGHAGNEATMRDMVRAAVEQSLRIGAHPSYPDRKSFGRIAVTIDPLLLEETLRRQVERLVSIALSEGSKVHYLKPHGALYNDAAASEEKADVIFRVADHFSLKVMALAGSRIATIATEKIIREGFIDRRYQDDGTLVPRTEKNALILDPVNAANQALALALKVDSLCVHSDTPNAVVLLKAAREALEREGYEIAAR